MSGWYKAAAASLPYRGALAPGFPRREAGWLGPRDARNNTEFELHARVPAAAAATAAAAAAVDHEILIAKFYITIRFQHC